MNEEIKFELIKKEDLKPGDMVIIKCKKEELKAAQHWADRFFPSGVRIGIVHDSIEFGVICDVRRGE